jgi:hypothetical protein
MNLHEYQAKQLFAEYGLPVSKGVVADSAAAAVEAASLIGGEQWVVKAQVHAGGRGKAGGVKLVRSKAEIEQFAQQWLGKRLVTYQTDADGQPVNQILVESCTDIDRELYLGAVVDRASQRVVFMASSEGGVEIEKVAERSPEKILQAIIDPLVGAQPYQAREIAFKLGLNDKQVKQFTDLFVRLSRLFHECDLALLEINPLVITKQGDLHCLDASTTSRWTGNIGCMVNGAGLAMAPWTSSSCMAASGQLPRRRRRRHRSVVRGLQDHSVRPQGQGGADQHLRRHRALRPDRRGHHRCGEGGGRQGPGRGASGRHQRQDLGARCWPIAASTSSGTATTDRWRHKMAVKPRRVTDMSILVNKDTKVICQGFTGKQGTLPFRAGHRLRHPMVGGVTPRQGRPDPPGPAGVQHREGRGEATGADASVIYVPAGFAADSILEAAHAGIKVVVCITEGIPVRDMINVKAATGPTASVLIGPNCPGHHPRRMQDRHHARLHPQARQGRHRLPLRHPDL